LRRIPPALTFPFQVPGEHRLPPSQMIPAVNPGPEIFKITAGPESPTPSSPPLNPIQK
jgi:hypothetical protein